jgi:hypothetical protein
MKQISQRENFLLKQQIWHIFTEEKDQKAKKILLAIKSKSPRISDFLICCGIFGMFTVPLLLIKKFQSDVRKNMILNTGNNKVLYFMPLFKNKLSTLPFVEKPDEREFRDLELFYRYDENLDDILFDKVNEYYTTLLHSRGGTCVRIIC